MSRHGFLCAAQRIINRFENQRKSGCMPIRMSDEAVASYLEDRGYLQPTVDKFGEWLGVLPGWVTEGVRAEMSAVF